jgi:hypothetical protein
MTLVQLFSALHGQLRAYWTIHEDHWLRSYEHLTALQYMVQAEPDTIFWQNYRVVLDEIVEAVDAQDEEAIQHIERNRYILVGWLDAVEFVMKSLSQIDRIHREIVHREVRMNRRNRRDLPPNNERLYSDGYLAGLCHCLEILGSEPPTVTPYLRCWRLQ